MSVLVIYVSGSTMNRDADRSRGCGSGMERLLRVAKPLGEVAVFHAFVDEENGAGCQEIRDCCASYQVKRLVCMKLDEEALAFEQIGKAVEGYCRNVRNIDTILLRDHAVETNIAAYLGVAFEAGVVTHVQAIKPQGTVNKKILGGSSTAEVRITSALKILTIADSYAFEEAKPRTKISDSPTDCPLQEGQSALEITSVAAPSTKKVVVSRLPQQKINERRPALQDATIVIAGGRGVGGDWTVLEELADAMGRTEQERAAIGATKAAVDLGWISHELQIGQSGAVVSPALYISAGISGAQQQKSGMQSSGTILVVNIDPDALVFEIADFGVIGDVHEVIPALTAEFKKRYAA